MNTLPEELQSDTLALQHALAEERRSAETLRTRLRTAEEELVQLKAVVGGGSDVAGADAAREVAERERATAVAAKERAERAAEENASAVRDLDDTRAVLSQRDWELAALRHELTDALAECEYLKNSVAELGAVTAAEETRRQDDRAAAQGELDRQVAAVRAELGAAGVDNDVLQRELAEARNEIAAKDRTIAVRERDAGLALQRAEAAEQALTNARGEEDDVPRAELDRQVALVRAELEAMRLDNELIQRQLVEALAQVAAKERAVAAGEQDARIAVQRAEAAEQTLTNARSDEDVVPRTELDGQVATIRAELEAGRLDRELLQRQLTEALAEVAAKERAVAAGEQDARIAIQRAEAAEQTLTEIRDTSNDVVSRGELDRQAAAARAETEAGRLDYESLQRELVEARREVAAKDRTIATREQDARIALQRAEAAEQTLEKIRGADEDVVPRAELDRQVAAVRAALETGRLDHEGVQRELARVRGESAAKDRTIATREQDAKIAMRRAEAAEQALKNAE